MAMNKKRMLLFLLMLAMLLSGCSRAEMWVVQGREIVFADTSGMDFSFTERELSGEYDAAEASCIRGENAEIIIDGPGVRLSGQGISIVDEGCYIFSGIFEDCMITVAAPEDEKVQIVLDGAQIRNSKGPAVYGRAADKLFITLAAGSENSIADGVDYRISEDDSNLDGAIFSRCDLCINGSGKLYLEGNYKHGVVSKDDLAVVNCNMDVTAARQALNGKDCVKIHGAQLRLHAGTDGVQSDNDEDEDRGFVFIEASKLEIAAGNDGIQAETVLKIADSDLQLTSGGGSGQALSGEDASCKGLKAGLDLLLEGGAVNIDSRDDCIHANGNVAVYAGDFKLSSGDDGLHADAGVLFAGGRMEILKSYEGLEGSEIHISGGELRITASDDGMNLAGGNDNSAAAERPGRGMFEREDGSIEISGGRIWIDALGDGIDSNGTIFVSGGVTLVSGPTGSGNAALDHNGATVTGGTLIATGSAGMALGFSAAENQGAILVNFDFQPANTSIVLCDAQGGVTAGFIPNKDFQSVVITAPGLQQGGSYVLLAGAALDAADADGFAQSGTVEGGTELLRIEMESELYNGGDAGFGARGFGGRGFGGMRDREDMKSERVVPPEGEIPEGFPAFPEGGMAAPGGVRHEPPEGKRPADMPALPEGLETPEGMGMWKAPLNG